MLGRGGRRNLGGGGGGGGTFLEVLSNLSDLNNVATARSNLGFTVNTAGRVLFGDGSTTMASDASLFFDTGTKHLSVNLAAPGSGASLDVGGTDGGVGLPVLTSTQRDALTPARNGVLLYNSTTHTLNAYQNGAWANLGDHGALAGLGDDDHTQYVLLAGRALGQSIIGGTGSAETLTLSSTSHATKGKITVGTVLTVDQANLRVGINTVSPSVKLAITASSASETVFSLINSAASAVDFRYESGGVFRVDQGAGSLMVFGNGSMNLMGTQTAVYKVQVQAPSTQTNVVTALTRNTGDTVFAVMNSSATANNVSGIAFACATASAGQTTSGIAGIHEVHTNGSETGHLGFYTSNLATLARRMKIAKDGAITMDLYTAGLPLFSAAGLISSLASGTAGRVLYSDGTTWAASNRKEKSGKVTLTTGLTSKAIAFASARSDALYSPFAFLANVTDADPIHVPCDIIALAAGGFTAEWGDALPTDNYLLYWGILEHYDP